VGEAIEKKINEMLDTGQLQFYEKLKAEVGRNTSEQAQK
jgi:DNA polymerase/3'-5' exonuclease PolX